MGVCEGVFGGFEEENFGDFLLDIWAELALLTRLIEEVGEDGLDESETSGVKFLGNLWIK